MTDQCYWLSAVSTPSGILVGYRARSKTESHDYRRGTRRLLGQERKYVRQRYLIQVHPHWNCRRTSHTFPGVLVSSPPVPSVDTSPHNAIASVVT